MSARYLMTANEQMVLDLQALGYVPINIVTQFKRPPVCTFDVTDGRSSDIERRFSGEYIVTYHLTLAF